MNAKNGPTINISELDTKEQKEAIKKIIEHLKNGVNWGS